MIFLLLYFTGASSISVREPVERVCSIVSFLRHCRRRCLFLRVLYSWESSRKIPFIVLVRVPFCRRGQSTCFTNLVTVTNLSPMIRLQYFLPTCPARGDQGSTRLSLVHADHEFLIAHVIQHSLPVFRRTMTIRCGTTVRCGASLATENFGRGAEHRRKKPMFFFF